MVKQKKQRGQQEFDFSRVLHKRENNAKSEEILKKNYYHLTGQCAVILSLLQRGVRLTSRSAMIEHGIGHLPRRIKDLKDAGAPILDEPGKDADGKPMRYLVWYIQKEDELF